MSYNSKFTGAKVEQLLSKIEENSGGAYPHVYYGTSNTTATLEPNTYYRWDVVSSLTITRGPEIPDVVNEYFFEFCSGTTPTTLTFTQGIEFLGGEPPVIGTFRRIQISIIRGLAVVLDFELNE